MNIDLEVALVERFPQIFRDYDAPPAESCMAFGFECDDGWYELLGQTCEKIMATDPPEKFRAAAVKEKLGGLRFYVSGSTDEIDTIITAAENTSFKVCELCGDLAHEAGHKTICASCRG